MLNISVLQQGSSFFKSPQEAVETISKLLIVEDWKTLSSYYYTEGLDRETIDSLKSGSYFINAHKPEVIHPSNIWKISKPFPPNFKYSHYTDLGNHLFEVTVTLQINQGNGMMQNGYSTFVLLKTREGFMLVLSN